MYNFHCFTQVRDIGSLNVQIFRVKVSLTIVYFNLQEIKSILILDKIIQMNLFVTIIITNNDFLALNFNGKGFD